MNIDRDKYPLYSEPIPYDPLTRRGEDGRIETYRFNGSIGKGWSAPYCGSASARDVVDRLFTVESEILQGLYRKLPCKVGDPVWVVYVGEHNDFCVAKATCVGFEIDYENKLRITTSFSCYDCYRVGNYVSESEAQQVCEALNNDNNNITKCCE